MAHPASSASNGRCEPGLIGVGVAIGSRPFGRGRRRRCDSRSRSASRSASRFRDFSPGSGREGPGRRPGLAPGATSPSRSCVPVEVPPTGITGHASGRGRDRRPGSRRCTGTALVSDVPGPSRPSASSPWSGSPPANRHPGPGPATRPGRASRSSGRGLVPIPAGRPGRRPGPGVSSSRPRSWSRPGVPACVPSLGVGPPGPAARSRPSSPRSGRRADGRGAGHLGQLRRSTGRVALGRHGHPTDPSPAHEPDGSCLWD
jgi:hypothetical protein